MDGSIANVGADLARITSGERAAGALARKPAEAAKSFEAMFATLLVKEMRRALPEGFFGGGTDGDVYAGWLDQTLGEAIAKSGALRLSDKVRESLEARAKSESSAADPKGSSRGSSAASTDAALPIPSSATTSSASSPDRAQAPDLEGHRTEGGDR